MTKHEDDRVADFLAKQHQQMQCARATYLREHLQSLIDYALKMKTSPIAVMTAMCWELKCVALAADFSKGQTLDILGSAFDEHALGDLADVEPEGRA